MQAPIHAGREGSAPGPGGDNLKKIDVSNFGFGVSNTR